MLETATFPDSMAVAIHQASREPWCFICSGYGLYQWTMRRWRVCPYATEKGHGRFMPRGEWEK